MKLAGGFQARPLGLLAIGFAMFAGCFIFWGRPGGLYGVFFMNLLFIAILVWRHDAQRKRIDARRERAEEALRVANQRLRELSALRDQLLANVSHELRTPLTTIKEGVSLILDEVLGPVAEKEKEFLKMIDANIDRLTGLIMNLLDLSRIETGKLILVRRRLALRGLMEKVLANFRSLPEQRILKTDFRPVPDVFADPDRIFEVLVNLVSNAVKFTKEKGHITVLVQPQDGSVAVSVQDDGVGIKEEDLPKLFHEFSQADSAEGPIRGAGLGLVLCKEIVELHRGKITVASERGQGSTFTLTLPVYTASLALEESFKEALKRLRRERRATFALIAVNSQGLLVEHESLPEVTELLRKQVHQEDIVLEVEPHWVVILSLTDQHGASTIIRRLQQALPVVRAAAALYPRDGEDAQSLFVKAASSEAPDLKVERLA